MKIYVDVTETLLSGLKTGIQRVVRRIIANAPIISKMLDVQIIPVLADKEYFYPLADVVDLQNVAHGNAYTLSIKQMIRAVIKRILVFKWLAIKWLDYRQNILVKRLRTAEPIAPAKKDVLLLLDSFWGKKRAIAPAVSFHQTGGIVIPVINDMFPITHPQYCDDYNVTSFVESLDKLLEISDGIMTISRTEVDEIGRILSSISPRNAPKLKIEYYYLGADFPGNVIAKNEEIDWPRGLWVEGVPVYLMVGTIEPRKQHGFVLDVFESRWQRGETDNLLIVGKVGWKTERVVQRILNSPHYGSRLFMVNNASDIELEDAYKRAYACIMASEVEGFGLPIIEALQRRLPVLASDIPVFREVGGNFCRYFVLNNIASLDRAIDDLNTNIDDVRVMVNGFRWLTWKESAEQLFGRVIKMAGDAQ